jgi:hypothetical protein
VIDVHATNIECFPSRDSCVSSTQLSRPIWSKLSVSPHENLDGQAVFLSTLTQFSQGNKVLDAPPSNLGGFLLRDTCVSTIHPNRPILNK